MRLAFSTNAFTSFSLDEAMKVIRGIGYTGVELMADRPHLWPPDTEDEHLRRIAHLARDLEINLCNINGFMMKADGDIHHPSWIERSAEDRKRRLDHTLACLEMARALGVPSVSTEPGGPLEGMDRAEALKMFAEGIASPAALAESLGVRLLIEPEPALLLERLDETVEFIESLGVPGLGVNFDLGHFYCIGLDPGEMIRTYSKHLEHVHIEDISEDRVHHHLIPGTGAMDFKDIFQALYQVGYNGFVTVELYPFEDEPIRAAEEAYLFLRPYLAG